MQLAEQLIEWLMKETLLFLLVLFPRLLMERLLKIVCAYREKKGEGSCCRNLTVSNLEFFSCPREKDDSTRAIGFLTAYRGNLSHKTGHSLTEDNYPSCETF